MKTLTEPQIKKFYAGEASYMYPERLKVEEQFFHDEDFQKYKSSMREIREAEIIKAYKYYDKEMRLTGLENVFWRIHCAPEHRRDLEVKDYLKACGMPHNFCDMENNK